MLACTQFGAQVIGSDIDFLMIQACTKPSQFGQKTRIKGKSFKENFEKYTLTAKLLYFTKIKPNNLNFAQSIFLLCTQFGALVIGSDTDFLTVNGSSQYQNVNSWSKLRVKGESFKGNFLII